MRPPIYEPTGKAKEYGDLAINIYTGCPHRCFYCFAPRVLHVGKEHFHVNVAPREGIVEEVRRQLAREKITGKLVHLCFTCDPYPTGFDSSATREIITLLKGSGNHVQILTKGSGRRDLDLLDGDDWYGITIDGSELQEDQDFMNRIDGLVGAAVKGVKTWISFEPVVVASGVFWAIRKYGDVVDRVAIGKMNYYPSDIHWKWFGERVEELCRRKGITYYIKDSLRKEMAGNGG